MNSALRDKCLEPLLAPIGIDTFLEQYWEQDVLHIAREDEQRYAGLLSIRDIESMLSTQSLDLSDAQLSGGDPSPVPEDYLDAHGKIVARRLLSGHQNGATLVLSRAQQRFAALADFCRDIQAGLAMRCQTNVYLSPAGQQGFRPHYDSHDVFILQVQGRKIFHFYAGGPDLPANHHRFDADLHQPGEHQGSIELGAGDALYIPRGVMHDAVAHPASPSLHITLGLFPLTLVEVLREMLRLAETDDKDLRRSIPGACSMAGDQEVHQRLHDYLDAASGTDRIDAALRELRNDLATGTAADCRNALAPAAGQAATSSATRVAARLERWHDVEDAGETLTVRTAGAVLSFRDDNARTVRRLAAGDVLESLLIEHDTEEASLVRTLEQHGLVTLDEPAC